VLTGGHGHANWGIAGVCAGWVVNGILWSAKVEVPPGGAKVDLDPADLMTNQERKPAKAVKPPAAKARENKLPRLTKKRALGVAPLSGGPLPISFYNLSPRRNWGMILMEFH